jgi:hypothetical protein
MSRRIVSIAAAPGWKARFLDEDELEGFFVVPLVSWALVEDADHASEVIGVVQRSATGDKPQGWLGFADEVAGFDGYAFTGLATRASET